MVKISINLENLVFINEYLTIPIMKDEFHRNIFLYFLSFPIKNV